MPFIEQNVIWTIKLTVWNVSEAFRKVIHIIRLFHTNDDVNNFTKIFAQILNFEFYCPYYIKFPTSFPFLFFLTLFIFVYLFIHDENNNVYDEIDNV